MRFGKWKVWPYLMVCLCMMSQTGLAQTRPEAYSHPELEWKTITTPHFTVSYHEGAERSARIAATIAEDVYQPITELYNHDPGTVNIIIKDTDDYSNGGAYFFENKLEIWAPALEFSLRGQHNWLRNVITHEYTHIVTLSAAMKFGTTVPAFYLQIFGYEQVRRPDVLYGFPNVLVSYPFSGIQFPFWLAEGVAQYQRPELRYDTWDSHRDMLLRAQVYENKLMDLDALSNYGSKNSLQFEYVYNAGYALTHYLAEKYGEKKLDTLCKAFSNPLMFNGNSALSTTYHLPAETIYQNWKTYLEQDYANRLAGVTKNLVEGHTVEQRGYANTYPLFSPSGEHLFYISNLGADYGGYSIVKRHVAKDSLLNSEASQTAAHVIKSFQGETAHFGACKVCGKHFSSGGDVLQGGVNSRFSISPDGKTLLYSRYTGTSCEVKKFNDLFLFDLAKEEETRITTQKRLETPCFSPNGKNFAAITQKDGTNNLVLGKIPQTGECDSLTTLTSYASGEQVLTPVFSPDGKTIYFSLGINNQRRLMACNIAQKQVLPVFDSLSTNALSLAQDDRDPYPGPDGNYLYFSSDRSGIFNIYRLDLNTDEIQQITNVVGGAFMPAIDQNGNLAYATFTATGYHIAMLPNAKPIEKELPGYASRNPVRPFPAEKTGQEPLASLSHNKSPNAFESNFSPLIHYDRTEITKYEEKEYEKIFSSPLVFPIVRFDTYSKDQGGFIKNMWRSAKFGAAMFSEDILGQLGFGGSLAIGPGSSVDGGSSGIAGLFELERDAYLTFEYNDHNFLPSSLLPKFTLDVYHQTRNVEDAASFKVGIDSTMANVFYSLSQFDLSLGFRVPINHWLFNASKFKLIGSLSLYTSKIGAFYWEPLNTTITASSDDYFIGQAFSFQWALSMQARTADREINPIGLYSLLRFDWEHNKLQRDVELTNSGSLKPVYEKFDIPRLTADLNFHLPLPIYKHTFTVRSYSAMNLVGNNTDFFFHNFISGLLGMRGYEYYAIGGDKSTFLHLEYRFPLWENINTQVLQFYFDKLYFSTYFDVGTAWSGSSGAPKLNDWKKDVGFELRLEAPSYYVFPTRLFFSATYGLDEFRQPLDDDFYTSDGKDYVTYGGEWMYHFGLLFDFDFILEQSARPIRGIF